VGGSFLPLAALIVVYPHHDFREENDMWRTKAAVITLAAVDVALFMVSGIPRYKDAKHGADLVIGEIVWIAFLVGLLALIVTGVLTARRTLTRRAAR
jgi:hypothetical protein